MTNRSLLLWCFFLPVTMLAGQSLAPSLLASAGAHAYDPSFGTLDWSVGETVVSTLDPAPGAGAVLTQGFHQVFVSLVTGTDAQEYAAFLPKIYPNPSRELVYVESPEPVRVRLFNLLGMELIPFGATDTFHSMILTDLPTGTYLLEIARTDNNPGQFFKLQIIQ
jgi:hypothetical protein